MIAHVVWVPLSYTHGATVITFLGEVGKHRNGTVTYVLSARKQEQVELVKHLDGAWGCDKL
jgi:hypothetical protein